MSIDAGGLAQMTYQSPFNHSIGISGPGFASRGKATHIKRLSVAPPPKISTIDETQQINISSVATPRTSRGHLLAGLRTAPKSATTPNTVNGFGLENSRYAAPQYNGRPQSTTNTSFANNHYLGMNSAQQMYSMPEQVLAPPAIEFDGNSEEQMDQNIYNELVATNAYLAQQQRALQQQLASVTAAAHQLGGLNLNTQILGHHGQGFQSQVTSPMSFYNQQFQQGLQPVVQPVPNSPGLFTVYNPMTGQTNYFIDNSQQGQDSATPPYPRNAQSPVQSQPSFQRQYSPQRESNLSPVESRSRSPPKSTPSPPQDHEPLPPPSANAFRRGHKKGLSSVGGIKTNSEWIKATPRSAAFPPTPMTGTFGPGQGRAGEHPVRQPRGPPLLQELEEKPTAKHEGSKNFATRQRRRAVHDLVRAGRERRSETRQSGGSGGGTPGSESEFTFSVSPSEDDLARSGSLSSKPSLGSLRAAASGAIGSERKEKSRERDSYSAKSLSSDEGDAVGGSMVEVDTARRTPMLVLNSAEKRKSGGL